MKRKRLQEINRTASFGPVIFYSQQRKSCNLGNAVTNRAAPGTNLSPTQKGGGTRRVRNKAARTLAGARSVCRLARAQSALATSAQWVGVGDGGTLERHALSPPRRPPPPPKFLADVSGVMEEKEAEAVQGRCRRTGAWACPWRRVRTGG